MVQQPQRVLAPCWLLVFLLAGLTVADVAKRSLSGVPEFQVMVKWKNQDPSAAEIAALGLAFRKTLLTSGVKIYTIVDGSDMDTKLTQLNNDARVAYAEADTVVSIGDPSSGPV